MPIRPTNPVHPNMHPGNISEAGIDLRTYISAQIVAGLVSNRNVWTAVEKATQLTNATIESGFVTIALGITDTLLNTLNKPIK